MIKLGCCAYNFSARPLSDALRLVKELGFVYVDVGASPNWTQVDQHAAATEPGRVGSEIRAAAKNLELELVQLAITRILVDGVAHDPNHPDAEIRRKTLQLFKGICQCAAEAGFQSIMGVPGKYYEQVSEQVSWDCNVEMMTKMVAIAQEYGVRFNVETAMGSVADKPNKAVQLAQEVPGLTYTLDYAHFMAQYIPQGDVVPVHEYTSHLHGKQARLGYRKAMYHEGEINFSAIIQALKARNWSGFVTIECIDVPSGQPDIPYPVYLSATATRDTLPPYPGLASLSIYQTALLAYDLEHAIGANATRPSRG